MRLFPQPWHLTTSEETSRVATSWRLVSSLQPVGSLRPVRSRSLSAGTCSAISLRQKCPCSRRPRPSCRCSLTHCGGSKAPDPQLTSRSSASLT